MDPINRATAEVVRSAIFRAGTTQKAVARAIGMPPTTWTRRITGKRSFQVSELYRIARELGLSPGSFIDEATELVGTVKGGDAA